MNLPFVLDSIMNSEHGLRPFDMEAFRINDARQPLYAVSSTVRGGKMETVAFNSKEGDFWDIFVDAERDGNNSTVRILTTRRARVKRVAERFSWPLVRLPTSVLAKTKNVLRRFTTATSTRPRSRARTPTSPPLTASPTTTTKKRKRLHEAKSVLLLQKSRRGRRLLAAARNRTRNPVQPRTLCPSTACPGSTVGDGVERVLPTTPPPSTLPTPSSLWRWTMGW